jgi:signal transduction histidine kinase
MYILVLILSVTSISLQDAYAYSLHPDNVITDLFHKTDYKAYQDTDTLSVTDSENAIEAVDSGISALDEMIYAYNLAAFSFTSSFLLALVLISLFYLFRIPQKQANGFSVLFSFILLVSCSSFFIPDLIETGDSINVAIPYIWIGSTSLAIHLLPYLFALVFNMRRLNVLLNLVWLAAIPLILLFLEIDFHTHYLSGAAVVVAMILFYLLYRANIKNVSGANYVISGTITAYVLALLLILDNFGEFQLQLSVYYIIVALLYIIIPASLTLCLYYRQMTDYTVMEHELQELSSELNSANEKLVQLRSHIEEQEHYVSLGQQSLNIARDIKNPINLVKNSSEVSIGFVETAQNDLKNSPHFQNDSGNKLFHLLLKIEEHLQKIQDQSTHADSKIKRMLKVSGNESSTMQLTGLNELIEEYVNLAKQNMMNSSNPIKVGIDLNLDKNVGLVPLIEKDFSRVILSLCKNAFDAMRIKMGVGDIRPEGQISNTGYSLKNYEPKLTIETKKEDRKISIKMEYNAPDVPDEVSYKNIQSIFRAKYHDNVTEHGKSVIHDILKSHGSELLIIPFGNGTSVYIELRA